MAPIFQYPFGTLVLRSSMSTSSAAALASYSASSIPPSIIPLVVGLGVGIPLGLALIVLMCLLLRQLRQYNKAVSGKTGQNAIAQPVLEKGTQAVGEATYNHPAQNMFTHRDQTVEAFSSPIHETPQRSM